jgi:hypothetical protein
MKKLFSLLLLLLLVTGCASAQKDYTKFNAANIRSLLIVPVVNRSIDVTAPDYFLSTTPIPLAEHGYYVFPVNMVKRLLEDDGLADADFVHNAPAERLGSLFGADAILYVIVEKWDAKYLVLSTRVTVELSYLIKDGRTGEELWSHKESMVYVPQNNSTGNPVADLLAMAVTAAVTKAAPNYMPLARQANAKTFTYPGPGVPPGPYSK